MSPEATEQSRTKKVVRAGVIGIFINIALSSFKALVGFASGSIAIILDAVNNLTDAISNVVTIVGTLLANKKPDAKHPYGYGRIEYMTSMVIAGFVLYAGISALVESVKKILEPTVATYTLPTFIVIIVAIFVKLLMSYFFYSQGKTYSSKALVVSSVDAKTDALLTSSTLLAACLAYFFHINIDGLIGAIISVVIIHEGVVSMKGSLDPVIGDAVDHTFANAFTKFAMSYPGVEGVYDLSVDDYGPTNTIATCHIEVADTMTARQLHELSRRMSLDAYDKFHIILTIGIYATNATGKFSEEKQKVLNIVHTHKAIKSIHALYIDPDTHFIDFDIVLDFKANGKKVRKALLEDLQKAFPDYQFSIVEDVDYTSR